MAMNDVTTRAVMAAIEEFDRLGRDDFLSKYGFRRSRTYVLHHDGKAYDSKAIVGVAHGYLPGKAPLTWADFSGGRKYAAGLLRELGFKVSGPD